MIVMSTPFYPQIKIKGVQIKIRGLQIKITRYEIKIRGHFNLKSFYFNLRVERCSYNYKNYHHGMTVLMYSDIIISFAHCKKTLKIISVFRMKQIFFSIS